MTDYITEQEQIEQLKAWFKQYGLTIISGVLLALLLVSGWHAYQNHVSNQLLKASAVYDELLTDRAQNHTKEMVVQANKLIKHYPKTSYAQLASLMLARNDVDNHDYANAFIHLKWTLENSRSKALQQLSKIRMARVLIAQKLPQEALNLLDKETSSNNFTSLIEEVRGDAYLVLNNLPQARAAYQRAVASQPDAQKYNRPILMMKLDNLATA